MEKLDLHVSDALGADRLAGRAGGTGELERRAEDPSLSIWRTSADLSIRIDDSS